MGKKQKEKTLSLFSITENIIEAQMPIYVLFLQQIGQTHPVALCFPPNSHYVNATENNDSTHICHYENAATRGSNQNLFLII